MSTGKGSVSSYTHKRTGAGDSSGSSARAKKSNAGPGESVFGPEHPQAPPPAYDASYTEYRKKVSLVSFYNHKGGVAKTTNAYAYGWAMAAKGARVLVMDWDAQCNLTQAALQSRMEASGHTWETFFAQLPQPHRIGDMLSTCSDPVGLSPGFAYSVAHFPRMVGTMGGVHSGGPGELLLVIGDQNMHAFESRLSKVSGLIAYQEGQGQDASNILGAPYHLTLMTAHAYKCDIVIFDLSPATSLLNQLILMTSDVFVAPCNPDFFSNQALLALTEYLQPPAAGAVVAGDAGRGAFYNAIMKLKTGIQSPGRYALGEIKPVFAGTIMSKFNNRGFVDSDGKADFMMSAAMAGMASSVAKSAAKMRTVLNSQGMAPSASQLDAAGISPYRVELMVMPDYAGLMAFGSKLGIPVPFLWDSVIIRLCEWSTRCIKDYYSPTWTEKSRHYACSIS